MKGTTSEAFSRLINKPVDTINHLSAQKEIERKSPKVANNLATQNKLEIKIQSSVIDKIWIKLKQASELKCFICATTSTETINNVSSRPGCVVLNAY